MPLLQPMYPGQTARIRRNLLNFVLAVDLGSADGLSAAAAAQTLFSQQLPIRWGILPLNTSLRIGESVFPRSKNGVTIIFMWSDL